MKEGRYFYIKGIGYLIEVSRNWGLALSLCQFQGHASLNIMLIFGNIFIKLPQCFHREVICGEIMASYGFSWKWGQYDRGKTLHLSWGYKSKFIYMPWSYVFIRHDILMKDLTWKRVGKMSLSNANNEGSPWNWSDKWQETYNYTYVRRNGQVQYRKATVGVEEREYRQRWLKWCPIFAMICKTIDVHFNDEVGERSGSWKGGTIGCSYDLLPNEHPLECLRRMERERKFT